MNDEASKQLTDTRFKCLVGVQRTTFEEMLAVLKTAYQLKHAKGGRKPKLSLEDLLMATLHYVREYRTYEEIAADFGVHESNLLRRSQWVEVTLSSSSQTNILAQLMDFFTGNGHLEDLSKISEPEKLYAYIDEAIA
ncbi:transposase-like protein%2C IS1381 ISSpn7 [Streptococcus pneumoniae]|nr:transposase-like protein%2C IS1381 ISSpn7 [Streptococcus pneumoniae]